MTQDIREQIDPAMLRELRDFSLDMADQIRAMAVSFVNGSVAAKRKSDLSFVTELDLAIERHLRGAIRSRWPGHDIVGEEMPSESSGSDWCWVIDPVDGTEELVRGFPYWGSILGLYYRAEPVIALIEHPVLQHRTIGVYAQGVMINGQTLVHVDPAPAGHAILAIPSYQDLLKHPAGAVLMTRIAECFPNYRVFRCCFGHSQVARGAIDAGIEIAVKPWDLAATRLLMEETGQSYHSLPAPGFENSYTAIFGKRETVRELKVLFDACEKGISTGSATV
jgi:fructose-1,6-bisphosphatase/inositol monophosphatase family enzyme